MNETDDQDFAPGVVEAVFGRPLPVIAAAIAGLVLAVAVTVFVLPERFSATATVTIADPQQAAFTSGGAITADYERYLAATATFGESRQVTAAAAEQLGDVSPTELSGQLSVTSNVAERTIRFTVTADDAAAVAVRANAMVAAFEDEHAAHLGAKTEQTLSALEEQIEATRARISGDLEVSAGTGPDEATALLNSLQERKVELTVNAAAYGSGVEFVETAQTPAAPASPSKVMNAAIGLLGGLLAGMAFVWFRADRQRLLESSDSPQVLLDLPLLGRIPEFPEGAEQLTSPADMPADEYQFVASALHARLPDDARVVLIGGVGPDVGTTVTAANLAIAAARDDLTVAVVDACSDEALTALLGQKPMQAGLLDLLSSRDETIDRQRLTWALGPVSIGTRSIRLLSLGTSSRSTTVSQLRSRSAQTLFDELASRFDRVIVDCGSVLDTATGGALAGIADAMVLVVRNGSPSDRVIEARERLAVDGMPLVGYVFSRADRGERRRFRTSQTASARRHEPAEPMNRAIASSRRAPALPAATESDKAPAPKTESRMNGVHAWPIPVVAESADAAVGPDLQGWAN